ncbi:MULTISPECIES: SseB family protein [Microbacterium]|jgi:hypothetical protein|uniref:SseB family protein n=1 Tax=Microbacterium mcarthurae TaxID=3035918 RepID=A0ABW9GFG6_9MICO|nr:SseB family protein [Microbacterium sp. ACRRU]MCG7416847.1 SseB family protein [Microbacterium sp. ACRRU]
MTGLRPENDLEVTMRSVRSGELPSERLAPALLEAELVVLVDGTPDPTTFQPLVVHRDDANFLAVFTATDQVPAELGKGRNALLMPGRLLISGAAPEVGLVVNPGAAGTMEIPPSALTALRQVSAAPSTRYFIREQMVDGQVVPVSVFRRRSTPEGPVDERLLDVDSWTDDRHGTVDKAIRFPLDADIEEISPEAAQDVFDMVARRSYVPLRRR